MHLKFRPASMPSIRKLREQVIQDSGSGVSVTLLSPHPIFPKATGNLSLRGAAGDEAIAVFGLRLLRCARNDRRWKDSRRDLLTYLLAQLCQNPTQFFHRAFELTHRFLHQRGRFR